MANQTARKVPPIRFKAFDAGWKDEEIGNVLAEKRRPIILNDQQRYELVTVKRRNEGIVSRGHLLGRDILVKNYAQLQTGDFVISKRQVVHGATGMVPPALDGAIVSNEYLTAVDSDRLLTEFLTIVAGLPAMRRKFFLSSYGVDIEKLFFDAEDWKKRSVTIPSVAEQTRISTFFRELDQLVRLHQRKHDKLLALKKVMLQRMFPQPGATTPEVRFKEFSGSWAKQKLGDLTSNIGSNTLSRACLNPYFGHAINIHYGDVLIKFGEILDLQNDGAPFVSDEALATKLKSSKLENGDIVMADAAEDEAVGKCTEVHNAENQIVLAGLHTIALRPLLDFAPFYLGYYLNSNAFHDQLLPFMQGTKVLSLSKSAVKKSIIAYPKSQSEQRKIGIYFRTLNALISQHATQILKLQQIKSACLEKVFV